MHGDWAQVTRYLYGEAHTAPMDQAPESLSFLSPHPHGTLPLETAQGRPPGDWFKRSRTPLPWLGAPAVTPPSSERHRSHRSQAPSPHRCERLCAEEEPSGSLRPTSTMEQPILRSSVNPLAWRMMEGSIIFLKSEERQSGFREGSTTRQRQMHA